MLKGPVRSSTSVCLTAPPAFAQGAAGPFPGSAVDSKTLKIQERVEELFEQGDYLNCLDAISMVCECGTPFFVR